MAILEKISKLIRQYKETCEKKGRLLKPYHDRKRTTEDLVINESISMLILEAEIRQLKEIIEDLEHIISQ